MIKLSRQAWNNVLIVTMIVMIFLFNSTNNILTGGGDAAEVEVSLLPQNSLILTLEFGVHKVERIGRGWRVNPPLSVSAEQLGELINNWTSATMVAEPGNAPAEPIVVVAWLAGESRGMVYQLAEEDGDVVVYVDNQRFRLSNLSIQALSLTEQNNA